MSIAENSMSILIHMLTALPMSTGMTTSAAIHIFT